MKNILLVFVIFNTTIVLFAQPSGGPSVNGAPVIVLGNNASYVAKKGATIPVTIIDQAISGTGPFIIQGWLTIIDTTPNVQLPPVNSGTGGSSYGQFNSSFSNLIANTQYYIRGVINYIDQSDGSSHQDYSPAIVSYKSPPICSSNVSCANPSCPDTLTTFNGIVSQLFDTTITLNIPSTYTDPTYGPITIDSTSIDSIKNLPPGISWGTECGMTTPCMYMPGQHCLLLTGTPTTAGTYTFSSYSTGYLYAQNYSLSTTKVLVSHYVISVSDKPTITTSATTSITSVSAISGGTLSNNGNAIITDEGIYYDTNTITIPPGGSSTKLSAGVTSTPFNINLSGLSPNTVYHVLAYATNTVGTAYGNQITFTTPATPPCNANPLCTAPSCPDTSQVIYVPIQKPNSTTITLNMPTQTTVSGISVSIDSVVINSVTNLPPGMTWATECGINKSCNYLPGQHCLLLSGTPTTLGTYTINVNSTAYVKAFGQSQSRVQAGHYIISVSGSPSLTTSSANSITIMGAITGGNITTDSNATVMARGVVWSNAVSPTIALNTKTSDGTGIGAFTSTLTGLMPNTTYYVRAYATNAVGTSYGNEITFTTPLSPAVTTTTLSAITSNTATGGGNVTTDGGSAVTARGVVWSTSTGATVPSVNSTSDGTGMGVFASTITGLLPSTTYYLRAYVVNANGTAYGNELTFMTLPPGVPPTISNTTTYTLVNTTTVKVTSNVTSDAGYAIIAEGVVWDTLASPTIALATKTNDGTVVGTFKSTVTGLLPGTTYHIRTYSTNSNGTAYGSDVIYTTPSPFNCSPDSSITLATPGIFPYANFETDTNNLNFSQTFTYSLPFSYINSDGNLVDIDSSFLFDVKNLPLGLTVQCGRNSQVPATNSGPNCIFYPGEIGCFTISGALPAINNQSYSLVFVLKDYGIIHLPFPTGDQNLSTYLSQGYDADTVVITVSNLPTGINSVEENKFGIVQSSPNPFSDIVTVKFATSKSENVDFYVSDLFGREVYRTSVNATSGINTLIYRADNISAGSYYFTISNETQKASKLMILVR
jgi:hypothetical protein